MKLLIDDMGGRYEAARRHLSVTGTIGVLRAAAKLGLLDFRDALDRLRGTNFRIAKGLLDRLQRGEEMRHMGLFDEIRWDAALPEGHPPDDRIFQTKSLDPCLDQFVVSPEGPASRWQRVGGRRS
jgi:hypothetical protein